MRVLVLLHPHYMPPEHMTAKELEEAPGSTEFTVVRALKSLKAEVRCLGVSDQLQDIRRELFEFKPHVIFNLLEEFAGEAIFDQNVVSYLELLGVKYTGCNPRGLILSRDKALAKKILTYHRIPTPQFQVYDRRKKIRIPSKLRYPLFVKTLTEEASLGISQDSIVWDDKKLKERIEYLFESFETDVMAETYIEGREFYVGMMGHERLRVFPTWELFFEKEDERVARIYSRRAKWDEVYRKRHGISTGRAQSLAPELENRIQTLCRRAYKSLQLSGYARMDLRVTKDGGVFLIEANPNPDIGEGEDFAAAARADGFSYLDLIRRILSLAKTYSPLRR